MNTWTATVTATTAAAVTSSRIEQLLLVLEPAGAAVAGGADDHLVHDIEVTLTVDTPNTGGAVDAGATAAELLEQATVSAGLGRITVTGLEVITVDEHDRRLEQPAYAELVGITEIAQLLGITRQRASALQTRPGFPQPLQVLAGGPVWPRAWIDRFASTWERKGGRPRKQLPTKSVYTFDPATDPAMAAVKAGDVITLDGAPVRVVERNESIDGRFVTLHLDEGGNPAS